MLLEAVYLRKVMETCICISTTLTLKISLAQSFEKAVQSFSSSQH